MFPSGPFIFKKVAVTRSDDTRSPEEVVRYYCDKYGLYLVDIMEVK